MEPQARVLHLPGAGAESANQAEEAVGSREALEPLTVPTAINQGVVDAPPGDTLQL